jgi:hypothetical protein
MTAIRIPCRNIHTGEEGTLVINGLQRHVECVSSNGMKTVLPWTDKVWQEDRDFAYSTNMQKLDVVEVAYEADRRLCDSLGIPVPEWANVNAEGRRGLLEVGLLPNEYERVTETDRIRHRMFRAIMEILEPLWNGRLQER